MTADTDATTADAPTTPALDLSGIDNDVRLQDDFYTHLHGGWLATAEIPGDQPMTGSFIRLRDGAEEAVRDIITGLAENGAEHGLDTEAGKIAGLYASFTDTEPIEAAGAEPIKPLLGLVDEIGDVEGFVGLLGRLSRHGVGGLIGFDSESDPGDPNRVVMFVGQSGIGLPDEVFYRDEQYAETRDAYRRHLQTMLGLAGVEDAESQAERVFALETEIASHHWDRVKSRDLRAMYNLMSLEELDASAPGLLLRTFLDGASIEESVFADVVVQQPSFFTEAAKLITEDRLPDWKSWARWKIITSFAPYLSGDFVEENFDFYSRTLNGVPTLRERWKRGVALVEGALGEAVGKLYVERHFPPEAKQRMDGLVANLVEAYRQSITDLDWMTEQTKAKALDKLSKFTPKIGYPTKWRDYTALEIKPDDLVGNVIRSHAFDLDWSLSKVGKPVDREEWLMTPQTVNAYYHPLRNEIAFPAAILQPPFFNQHADDAVNYGGIGSVIGHEIGHGFDDQGSTCDGDGRLINWWTDEDRAAFEERTKALIDQFDALEPAQTPGHRVNGSLTIGENIGDLGGVSIAYKAYKIAQAGAEPEPIDGLTGDQRFFLGYAAIWQTKMRSEALIQRLATDPHSPAEFRCNQIVRNVDEFYTAFGVTDDDRLWLGEEQRVRIW